MSSQNSSITTGNITGTGIAVGSGAQATVTVDAGAQQELLNLIAALRQQVQNSSLPEGARNVLLTKAVPEMEAAATSPDPKSGLAHGLQRIDDQLQGIGAVAGSVGGIVETVSKIASIVGVGVKVVAPFIAGLL
ncbi:MAG TPA: hypothetical protein VMD92_05675 [Acidobacteriaceae bacterium]|jgi:hypothetical protein|nr:hypothetical protein [Acidobacteriaceae bacterium]